MKLLFLILAHNQPSQLVELAETITAAATDAHAIIHFDANASLADYQSLEAATTNAPKITLVKDRVACRWGDYSLVQATINGLREARDQGRTFDYVVLLSGACLPCRPIKQMERYLTENYGREFIEADDESWMIGGLRNERYELYFPLGPKQLPRKCHHYSILAQRALGVKRRPPENIDMRFGSQWWALTWNTCIKIVDHLENKPKICSFFKTTYIPDEIVFPTLTNLLAPAGAIAGFGFTYFQFTDKGKPTVFYDDHGDYPFQLERFFYRKVSDEAKELRNRSLAQASAPDDGEPLDIIGQPNFDYEIKARAQTYFPTAGQLFYRDQYADMGDNIVKCEPGTYILICGPSTTVGAIMADIAAQDLVPLGHIFRRGSVDFGARGQRYEGLRETDAPVRDINPFLYLARVKNRTAGIPVIAWSPEDDRQILQIVSQDRNALIITLPTLRNDRQTGLTQMATSRRAAKSIPGVAESRAAAAHATFANTWPLPDELTNGLEHKFDPRIITCPLLIEDSDKTRKLALEIFEKSWRICRFQNEPWFSSLVDSIGRASRLEHANVAGDPQKP